MFLIFNVVTILIFSTLIFNSLIIRVKHKCVVAFPYATSLLVMHGFQWTGDFRASAHGGVTGKILEKHVRENIRWILFKTRNFYIFLDIQ